MQLLLPKDYLTSSGFWELRIEDPDKRVGFVLHPKLWIYADIAISQNIGPQYIHIYIYIYIYLDPPKL